MTTLKDRREADRKRQERHRERQAQAGKKTVNATISTEAYEALQALKEVGGGTNSTIIEGALLRAGASETDRMVSLDDRSLSLLKALCERTGDSPEMVIRRALRTYSESTPALMVPDPDDF